jgi:peptidoglycan hydrolase-like protein with peptidoglycan-binding domain
MALQRELAKHGYAEQVRAAQNGLRLAVLAYEFDNGLALTGEPAETLLKRLLFDLNQAPKGVFADRAEANSQLVMEVQKTLLGLGFFRGALSGRMDGWTEGAVKDFERHRGLLPAGRLTEAALLELITYSGQPLQFSSG